MLNVRLASIIVTSYNYDRFLREAIDSALNQTYSNVEVIVVDDGSTDNSREIIAEYSNRIVPVLKENGGQASAFNAGYRASRGDILFFLDSDDALLPTAVEKAAEFFHDARVAKVHWPLWQVDEHGQKVGQVVLRHPLGEGDLLEDLIRNGPDGYGWPPTSGNAWARRVVETIFPIPEEEYITCPDSYLAALTPLFGDVRTIPEPQALYRVHGQNSMGKVMLSTRMRMFEHCCTVLSAALRNMGVSVDPETWKQRDFRYLWMKRLHLAIQEISILVPPEHMFLLVDDGQWETGDFGDGRRAIPFLERDGQYGGPPADDETGIRELERLRQAGASFMVFAWPAFWWLDYYEGLHQRLRSKYRCVLENERLVVFDLWGGL